MIILEGVDSSGKTRLATDLAKEVGHLRVIHSGGPVDPDRAGERIVWCQVNFKSGKGLIFDRIPFISEEVYGEVLRDGNAFKKNFDWPLLLDWFKSFNPLIIYCRPPTDVITITLDNNSHMTGINSQSTLELIQYYDNYMEELVKKGFNIFWYDWTDPDTDMRGLIYRMCHNYQANQQNCCPDSDKK